MVAETQLPLTRPTQKDRVLAQLRDGPTCGTEFLGGFARKAPLRFWSKLRADPDGCWRWIADLNRTGYGYFWSGGSRPVAKMVMAHRWLWERLHGPVPSGLEIDHLCRVSSCCNPLHLEPVTHSENVRRGSGAAAQRALTHCKHGHEFTPKNTYLKPPTGYRGCRNCRRRL